MLGVLIAMATRAIKFFGNLLFFGAVFFTTVCFIETWRQPFFINSSYKMLKLILCFALPFCATIICYLSSKSFKFIGKASQIIMFCFIAGYIIDSLTIKWIATFGSFVIIFHLAYGLISVFSVFVCATVIKLFTKDVNNGYDKFFDDFFLGFSFMLAFIFVLIYFVIRDYSSNGYILNLVPFRGEIGDLISGSYSKYDLIRGAGNVFFYTGIAFVVIRFCKKREMLFGIIIPVLISFACEVFQYIFVCGDADIDDIIANTLGAIIGVVLYKLIVKDLRRKQC
jgi:hypothetical protein